ARVLLVDPVHHRTAGLADAYFQPRPAGDFALAMAVARLLFDREWIDPEAARYCDHLDAFRALACRRSVEEWCRDADIPFIAADRPPRTVCEPLFGPEVLAMQDPPIRAVWVTCGNPVAMLPESHTTVRALASREFVVVVDSFLTDTARLAHLVLPTTTLLEAD